MTINLLILVIGIAANLILGLSVLLRNRKSATSVLFFLLTVVTALWSLANQMTLGTKDLLSVLVWTRIVMALAVPQAILFFFLIHTLPDPSMRLPKPWLYALTIFGVIVMAASMSPYLFPSVIFVNGTPSPTPGPAMPLFVVVAVGSLMSGIATLYKRLKSSKGILHSQLQVIGIGIVLMFALIFFFNFVLVVVFQISTYISASPLYTLPFVAATAYAIIRHRFLDIRLVIARAVSYTIVISVFGIAYALIFALTSSLLVSPYIDPKFIAISTVAALLMLLTFPMVKRGIEQLTDEVFYKGKYDTSSLLYRIAQIMVRTLRLEELGHQLLASINKEFQIEHSSIVLTSGGKIFSVYTEGYEHAPEVPEYTASYISAFGKVRQIDDEKDPQILSFFASLDAAAILPLETSQRAIGLLCVGTKRSGEPFSSEDIHTLKIIASEAAVAMENSLSYEEIRRFNVTLEDEVKHATEDLRQANEKLEQLDKLKDEFVSLASHELRTPLTSIRSYLWMALSGSGGELTEKQKFYLGRSFTSADRLIKMVNDMLNISRIESGRVAVQFERASLPKVIDEIIAEVQPKIDEHKLNLKKIIPRDLPDVIADTDKIKEVLINFLGNSVKFTPTAGTITVELSMLGTEWVKVAVSDSGIGFIPEQADRLFKKFSTLQQLSNMKSEAYQSTGLGLYISKSIIMLHGGKIQAESAGVGKGATFWFTVPVYSAQRRELMQKKHSETGLGIIHSSVE